jgi:hypothetical protein
MPANRRQAAVQHFFSRSSQCKWSCHDEGLEIHINRCRTDGVPHFRTGAAISTDISKTEISRRNCESESNVSSEKRELPASSARGEVDWSKTLPLHSGVPQEIVTDRRAAYISALAVGHRIRLPPTSENRGDVQSATVHEAVGYALSNWELMEEKLAELYLALAGAPNDPVRRAFGSIESNSGRRKAIEAAAEAYFGRYWEDDEVRRAFRVLIKAVEWAAKRRDDIAHGIVLGQLQKCLVLAHPVRTARPKEIQGFRLSTLNGTAHLWENRVRHLGVGFAVNGVKP